MRGNRLNILLLALPIGLVLEFLGASDVLVFVFSALAVVPLAGLIGGATEQVARYVGPSLGGFLNATFGNAAELIIAVLALRQGLVEVVKASLTGSLLGNVLLVLGAAMLVGGWGRERQVFNRTAVGASGGLLLLAVGALYMPDIYAETLNGDRPENAPNILLISLLVSIVMLGAYAASLVFTLKTHRPVLGAAAPEEHEPPELGRRDAVLLLAGATVLTAVAAEVLVGSIQEAATVLGLSELFVGGVVVAIVGNAAEHFSAVMFARRDHMDLSVGIALGSASQVALVVAPIAVVVSVLVGHPMVLVFDHFELGAILIAVLGACFLALDGESNWFEGTLLLAIYLIVAIIFFFVPQTSIAP
ncbi:MAG: calcium/proton exchanger [Chloroflexi bacterium]|nr:calcium/proton exchanger [Chloroflexota bacterium]